MSKNDDLVRLREQFKELPIYRGERTEEVCVPRDQALALFEDAIERGAAQGVVTDAMVERAKEAVWNTDAPEYQRDYLQYDHIIRAALEAAITAPPAPAPDAGEECPTCGSKAPHLHPAVQSEGEVEVCPDAFHLTPTPQNRPEYIKRVQAKDPTPQPPAVEAEAVDEIERLMRSVADLSRQLHAAEASNKALRKGLEPFADAASVVPGLRDEDECGVAGSYPPEGFKGRITVGDLRRARALLSETGGE